MIAERTVDDVLAAYKDSDKVTVLHGWGRLAADKVEYVDAYKFTGGVCREVPFSVAKHWLMGTRPDGKQPAGHVEITVLDRTATEADFVAATGLTQLSEDELVANVKAANMDRLLQLLGDEGVNRLVNAINERRHLKPRK